jgi:hypothetical protein
MAANRWVSSVMATADWILVTLSQRFFLLYFKATKYKIRRNEFNAAQAAMFKACILIS